MELDLLRHHGQLSFRRNRPTSSDQQVFLCRPTWNFARSEKKCKRIKRGDQNKQASQFFFFFTDQLTLLLPPFWWNTANPFVCEGWPCPNQNKSFREHSAPHSQRLSSSKITDSLDGTYFSVVPVWFCSGLYLCTCWWYVPHCSRGRQQLRFHHAVWPGSFQRSSKDWQKRAELCVFFWPLGPLDFDFWLWSLGPSAQCSGSQPVCHW